LAGGEKKNEKRLGLEGENQSELTKVDHICRNLREGKVGPIQDPSYVGPTEGAKAGWHPCEGRGSCRREKSILKVRLDDDVELIQEPFKSRRK